MALEHALRMHVGKGRQADEVAEEFWAKIDGGTAQKYGGTARLGGSMTTPANKKIADELERLSGAFEIDLTTHPPRIRVTRDIGSISTLDELFRRAAAALREEGGERGRRYAKWLQSPEAQGEKQMLTVEEAVADAEASDEMADYYERLIAYIWESAYRELYTALPKTHEPRRMVALGKPSTCPSSDASKPSESDVDGLAKLMRALAGDEYNSRIDPVTWQQPDYDGAARNFLARLSERRQGVTLDSQRLDFLQHMVHDRDAMCFRDGDNFAPAPPVTLRNIPDLRAWIDEQKRQRETPCTADTGLVGRGSEQ